MKRTERELDNIIDAAMLAGRKAAEACKPAPMYVEGYEPVLDGPCGFAWVHIRPAYCQMAKRLVARGIGRRDSYAGGICVWVSDYRQSMTLKDTHARAFAATLTAAGVRAYAGSRMD